MGVAALMAPIALRLFGSNGIVVVATFAGTMVLSEWLSAGYAAALSRSNRFMAGLLLAMGTRMVLPLAMALAIIVYGRQFVPAASVLCVVPLYLAMLATDSLVQWRRLMHGGATVSGLARPSFGSNPSDRG